MKTPRCGPRGTPPLRHATVALRPWQRHGVYATLTVLTLSGIAWLLAHGLVPDGDLTALHCKRWAIRLHAAAAPLSLLVIGSVLTDHVRLAWRLRKNRRSGVAMTITLGLLVSTSYTLGYAPDGALRQWSAWTHWAAGLALPLALLLHVALGRGSRTTKPVGQRVDYNTNENYFH